MERFEELQALWQRQPQNTDKLEARIRAATVEFRSYGARELKITIVKTVFVALALGAVWLGDLRPLGSMTPVTGGALMLIAVAAFLYGYWRNQLAIARLDFAGPSLGFLRAALAAIERQERYVRRYVWVLMLVCVVSMNVSMAASFGPAGSRTMRITAHVVATAIPLVCPPLVLKIRQWRLGARHRDLVERLRAIEQALSEEAPR